MPRYDIVLMVAGTGAFLYFTFFAMEIIKQGAKLELFQIIIGIIGIIALAEVCRLYRRSDHAADHGRRCLSAAKSLALSREQGFLYGNILQCLSQRDMINQKKTDGGQTA